MPGAWKTKLEQTAGPRLLLALSLTSLAACATPYQQMGYRGGFEDAWIRDDTYFLNVQTNAFTSQLVAAQYFHRRARELCYEHGYQDYRIVNERDTSGAFASYGGGWRRCLRSPV
jgi:hypothetical protein